LPATQDPAVYGEEDKRAELLVDILHMALVCDLTRAATFQFFHSNSTMSAIGIAGVSDNIHQISHYLALSQVPILTKVLAWQSHHFARLVRKLKDTPDVDGSTVLDNTALLMTYDAGYGFDPFIGGDPNCHCENENTHSSENMCVLVAGRAGGLKPGKHVVATGKHPAQVVNSAMRAVGVNQDLGEVSGTLPELFA
jgi:hypothetical protein